VLGNNVDLRAPFPYFGGKYRVADLIWERIGDVPNWIEPFAGSLAVTLKRPHPPKIETVNDKDCYLANFWRALQAEPEAVAAWADWPVNEADQHARHLWLIQQAEFRERMQTDPDYYDVQIAGWWVWGQSIWIGSGWCQSAYTADWGQLPHLGDAGRGVHRQLPHLGNAGMGVHRQRPHLGNAGMGYDPEDDDASPLVDYLNALAARLRRVRVCCGDWSRICGPTPTVKQGLTGVFLDPPYGDGDRVADLYAVDSMSVAADVRAWALEWGDDPRMRIALCGYEGEHDMPPSWECVAWKAHGGYGSQGNEQGRENAARERIWFSPHCLKPGFGQLALEWTS
jgi:hypothetical protein